MKNNYIWVVERSGNPEELEFPVRIDKTKQVWKPLSGYMATKIHTAWGLLEEARADEKFDCPMRHRLSKYIRVETPK